MTMVWYVVFWSAAHVVQVVLAPSVRQSPTVWLTGRRRPSGVCLTELSERLVPALDLVGGPGWTLPCRSIFR